MRNRFVDYESAIRTRSSAIERRAPVGIIDPAVDNDWARAHMDSRAPNPYLDYYYAAEDMRVYVAETGSDPEFSDLPMHELGFSVTQEKAPVYGAFSYTYDAVMRGTRLVNGTFTLVTKYPNYMKRLLTKAADNRRENMDRLQDPYPRPQSWQEDDANIRKYWTRHLDPSAIAQGKTEWSIHPPFTLVVQYGIQDTSVVYSPEMATNPTRRNRRLGVYESSGDTTLMRDHNQRLIESENDEHADTFVLDAVELMGVNRIFSPNSPVVMEQYEFMARDIIILDKEGNSFNTRVELPNPTTAEPVRGVVGGGGGSNSNLVW